MPTLNLAYIAELALKYARKYLYAIKFWAFVTVVVIFLSSFIFTFVQAYNLTQQIMNTAAAGNGGELVSKMFGLMNCMGLTAAFNDTKVLLIAAFSFLFLKILFAQVISIYYKLLRTVSPLIR